MNKKMPWEQHPEIWKDEKTYLNYCRSLFRQTWNKLKIKFIYKKSHTYKKKVGMFKNGKPKYLNYCKCEICKVEHKATDCEVDHIIPAGSFDSVQTMWRWVEALLIVGADELEVLCKECHNIKTYSENNGVTIEESRRLKPLRNFKAEKAADQKSFLKKKGYPDKELANEEKRLTIFKKCCMKLN